MTEWRTLPWLAGYEVSENGGLRRTTTRRSRLAGRELSGTITSKGYRHYCVLVDGKYRTLRANRLVCEAWHGPPPFEDAQAAHGDNDRLNNSSANLRWASPRENTGDRLAHGTWLRGEQIGTARLTWKQVREIRALEGTDNLNSLARRFGVARYTIARIIDGTGWVEEAAA